MKSKEHEAGSQESCPSHQLCGSGLPLLSTPSGHKLGKVQNAHKINKTQISAFMELPV